jgi:hypothetical protein
VASSGGFIGFTRLSVSGSEAALIPAVEIGWRLVHRGDLPCDLADLAAKAPREATLVVYHSAVLAYLDEVERRAFAEAVRASKAVWLANEAPGVVPDSPTPDGRPGFLLVKDDTELLARSDPHGAWVEWLG